MSVRSCVCAYMSMSMRAKAPARTCVHLARLTSHKPVNWSGKKVENTFYNFCRISIFTVPYSASFRYV